METHGLKDRTFGSFHAIQDTDSVKEEENQGTWWFRTRIFGRNRNDGTDYRQGWKPLSISTPILAAIAALTLLIAALIETIAQRSLAEGGLALSPTLDDIPYYAMFGYLYVPNIVAVIYSLIWTWVDLDVKRMQPWFELSKPGGATAEHSLFLDYPYDFVAFVPIKAAKRKHWPVFYGGTTMMIVFWLITPLQSAILGTGVVPRTETVLLANRSRLLPLSEQTTRLNPEIINAGYAVSWLGQPLPPFTAPDYATLPFYLENDPAPTQTETNWTTSTTKLSTELECWPAEVSQHGPESGSIFDFLNGQGCNATISIPSNTAYSMQYIGYYSSPYSEVSLASPYCKATSNSTHQFLSIWTKTLVKGSVDAVPKFHITAQYCQPRYYKQEVLVTVGAASLKPHGFDIKPLSPREALSSEEFNSTGFEYLLANGIDPNPVTRDYPFNAVIEQRPRLIDTGIAEPASNMVGFALAGQNRSTEAYSDPDLLQQVYMDAHQSLFSVAVSMLLTNETSFPNHTATSTFPLYGVIVSRVFSAVVEGLLLLVTLIAILLMLSCRTSPCNLDSNPSSIARLIDIFRSSPDLVASFHRMDNADDQSLLEPFRNDYFRLRRNGIDNSAAISLERVESRPWNRDGRKSGVQKGYYDPIRPLILRHGTGAVFLASLLGAVAGLIYLKQKETTGKGLIRPTDNFELLQLLENYIPTVFATLVEPFWVLLNRLLCVLQPFKDLWVGRAKPATSIEATYTSVPPQLALWRALKSRHFVLVLVCTVALLANVLAIGLGALFNEEPTLASYPQSFKPVTAARFNNESVFGLGTHLTSQLTKSPQYQDHMYIAMANISSGTSLPPWVSSEYFFQPFNFTDPEMIAASDTFVLSTQGFGVNANCTNVAAFDVPVHVDFQEFPPDPNICGNPIDAAISRIRTSTFSRSSGLSAVEYCNTLGNTNSGLELCEIPLTLAWGRSPHGENPNATVAADFVICRPIFETAMFNVTVDSKGYVLSYNRTSPLKSSLNYKESELQAKILFIHSNHQLNPGGVIWHNDTLSRDWMNYLIAISTNSRSALDPSEPATVAKEKIPVVEDLYRLLFAILLSLNQQVFESGDSSVSITGTKFTNETRIFMDNAAFVVTMTVLGLFITAAVVFYARAVVFVLPRMPTTIGSVLAYVAPSRLMTDQDRMLYGQQASTYSFGRYLTKDGEAHVGIEMDPHVVPVDPSLLRERAGFLKRRYQRRPFRSGTWL